MAKEVQEFTKYERARIIGARALQLAMDAPLLLKVPEKDIETFQSTCQTIEGNLNAISNSTTFY
jgi:hypothetical protein